MRYSKLFFSLVVVLFVTMLSIRAEANSTVISAFENFYGDTINNLYPDATNVCNILCHVSATRSQKNWYGDCLKYSVDTHNYPKAEQYPMAVADCDTFDSEFDGWTTNTEVLASHGLGRPTLPGNNFAEAQSLSPDGGSVSTITTLQAVFSDLDYSRITSYTGSFLDDQPARVEWEIDEAGQGFSNGTGLLQQSGPLNIYNSVYSNTPAENTFTWTTGVLVDNIIYSWRVRFMDGNANGDTHEWGNWAYASFSTFVGPCTDSDGDTYAIEGGPCGMVDCDDTDPAVNPGAAEVCGDGIDNNCDTQIDEGCVTCTDADGDGYYAEAGCGTEVDCDDSNPDINPGACDIKRNGIDEDCDGSDRHGGPACSTGNPEICDDGIDNDGDGYIDCADADCAGDPACGSCVPSAEVCDDGIDNDCDGKVDCADRKDCKNFPGC